MHECHEQLASRWRGPLTMHQSLGLNDIEPRGAPARLWVSLESPPFSPE